MAKPTVRDIGDWAPDDAPLYFFDSNVWIAILNQSSGALPVPRVQPYLDFWEALVKIHPPTSKTKPQIALPALVLTETLNAWIRIAAKKYFAGRPFDFKRDYRPTDDYRRRVRQFLSDFEAFRPYLLAYDDGFSALKILDSLSGFNPDFDFNDYFFATLFKGTDVWIVTDDSDYAAFAGIQILTANRRLL